MSLELLAVVLLILTAEFVNGWTAAPNAIATMVGTRALSPRGALGLASGLNLVVVLSGTAVALGIRWAQRSGTVLVGLVQASLLVMGAYGRSTLREFFAGSVTRTMLRESPVPLFFYH